MFKCLHTEYQIVVCRHANHQYWNRFDEKTEVCIECDTHLIISFGNIGVKLYSRHKIYYYFPIEVYCLYHIKRSEVGVVWFNNREWYITGFYQQTVCFIKLFKNDGIFSIGKTGDGLEKIVCRNFALFD